MRMACVLVAFCLAACVSETKEGCPVMISEAGQKIMAACQQAHYEKQARETGGDITRCFPGAGGSMTCISQ